MTTTAAVPTGYAIERVDFATASDDLMAQVVALEHALDAEAVPEDPPRPADLIAARYRVISELWQRQHWGAFASGQLVARAGLFRNLTGSNAATRDVDIAVHPAHRRRGLGRALLAACVSAVDDAESRLLEAWTGTRVPAGAAFAERIGATGGLHMRASQLDLATIDRSLMREWASIDPAGYRIEWIIGDTPDHLMDNVIEALRAINRMPREGLDMEDWKFTPEIIRDGERTMKARGQEGWFVLAIHESGSSAGFTDVSFDRRFPHVVQQRGTAVVPEHQGKGIGKWMKARMVEKILAELPEARYIRTENAGSNAPMLAINIKMGFRPAWENTIWQIPLADARRYVSNG
jgi:mycothiol synthase